MGVWFFCFLSQSFAYSIITRLAGSKLCLLDTLFVFAEKGPCLLDTLGAYSIQLPLTRYTPCLLDTKTKKKHKKKFNSARASFQRLGQHTPSQSSHDCSFIFQESFFFLSFLPLSHNVHLLPDPPCSQTRERNFYSGGGLVSCFLAERCPQASSPAMPGDWRFGGSCFLFSFSFGL